MTDLEFLGIVLLGLMGYLTVFLVFTLLRDLFWRFSLRK